MIIKKLVLPPSGPTAPLTFSFEGGFDELNIEPSDLPSVSAVVLSLLYPASFSPALSIALANRNVRAKWSLVAKSGKRSFRITRRALPESVVLELDAGDGEFQRSKQGAKQVEKALKKALKMPPLEVSQALFMTNSDAKEPERQNSSSNESSSIEVMGNNDYFGSFEDDLEETTEKEQDSPEKRAKLTKTYRAAYENEALEEFSSALVRMNEETNAALAAILDETGELGELTKKLAELPKIANLENTDEDFLHESTQRLTELDKKDQRIAAAFKRLTSGQSGPLTKDPIFIGGILLACVLTAFSLSSIQARPVALGNIFVLGGSLASFLKRLANFEDRQGDASKASAIERSRKNVQKEKETLTLQLAELTSILGVASFDEYLEILAKKKKILAKMNQIKAEQGDALDTIEFKRLSARQKRVEKGIVFLKEIQKNRKSLETAAYEIATDLSAMKVQPTRVIWQSANQDTGLIQDDIKALLKAASYLELWNEEEKKWINPKIGPLWKRLCASFCEEEPTIFDNQIALNNETTAFINLEHATQNAVVDMLRLAIILQASKHSDTRMASSLLRCFPFYQANKATKIALQKAYKKLGSRLQVILISEAKGV